MRRSFFATAIFLFLGLNLLVAQKVTLSGFVTDSLSVPLEVANVVAVNQADQRLDGFGITNGEGFFKINVKQNADYKVTVSYLGFAPREIPVTTTDQDIRLDVILYEKAESLDEVEVVYEIPITVKGDTIVYNTDSFVSGTERKLADVLNKLPGIEVNDDGEIEVEGKRVSKVMVEGEDFFDGDSKLASKNIPANTLDKVEVLRNFSEVSQLRGVTNNQDNVALNIKLKEGKKKFWFGDLEAGLGLDERYVVNPRLFYYSPKYSINILSNINNIGELPYTPRDFRNFSGGLRGATRNNNGTQFNTGNSTISLSQLQNNRASSIDNTFGALNFSYKPSDALRVGGFVIYAKNNTLLETDATRTFISSGQTEQTDTDIDQDTEIGLVKWEASYEPSEKLRVSYEAVLQLSDERQTDNILSIADVTDEIVEQQAQKPLNLTQNANAYYTHDEDHIFALETQYIHSDEDPFYEAIRSVQPFEDLIPFDENQSAFDANQQQRVLTNRVDAKLDYFWILGPKSNLNFTLGTTQASQNFDSRIFQILDNGAELDFSDETLNNRVGYHFSDTYLGIHYRFILGKLTLNPGASIHNYSATNEQLGTSESDKLTNVVPHMFAIYQFKDSESLRFNYSVQRNFTDITNLAQGYVFSNYNAIYQGNRALESALYHNVSLNYFNFNMFNLQNIFANLRYSKRIDAFKTSTSVESINQARTTINSDLADETLSGSANYQRTFGRVKVSGRANLAYSNTFNIINGAPENSKSLTQNYTASVGSSFVKAPNLELGYRYTVNDYITGASESTFFTDRPFVKFDAAFLKGFVLLVDYDYYFYRDKANTLRNEFGFLNASLTYQKKDSKWEYGIHGTNLTNNQVINNDSFNDFFFRTSAYAVQPRFLVFKVRYQL
ncbi:MAG: outer membrane beta-barrel protein [Bacteroidota bacterium]